MSMSRRMRPSPSAQQRVSRRAAPLRRSLPRRTRGAVDHPAPAQAGAERDTAKRNLPSIVDRRGGQKEPRSVILSPTFSGCNRSVMARAVEPKRPGALQPAAVPEAAYVELVGRGAAQTTIVGSRRLGHACRGGRLGRGRVCPGPLAPLCNDRARLAVRSIGHGPGQHRRARWPARPRLGGPGTRQYSWAGAVLALLVLEVGLAAVVLALR